jgi:hypothetical protein
MTNRKDGFMGEIYANITDTDRATGGSKVSTRASG